MTAQEIAAALRRVEAVVARRPDFAMHEEAPATARWEGGTRTVASQSYCRSPISSAVRSAVPVDLKIEIGDS